MDSATRIKYCGITRPDDADHAVAAGAWALGMILWPGSPRCCELAVATRISMTHRRAVEIAGVFVNQPLDDVVRAADIARLSLIQLHGDEGPAFASEVARATGARVIKAARIASPSDVQAIAAFRTDFHLYDSFRPGMRGGTGESFDWSLAAARIAQTPLILSGGLDAGNVAAAIEATGPFAVDVASGVESAPGVKDHDAIDRFAAAVAAADRERAASVALPLEETQAPAAGQDGPRS